MNVCSIIQSAINFPLGTRTVLHSKTMISDYCYKTKRSAVSFNSRESTSVQLNPVWVENATKKMIPLDLSQLK